MKVEVGQWVRDNKIEAFFQLKDITSTKLTQYFIDNNNDFIKIADTPQELIQVGDLVCIEKLPPQCIMEMKNNRIYVLDVAWSWRFENVTAIYTPNKDKTQYTEQWRKE